MYIYIYLLDIHIEEVMSSEYFETYEYNKNANIASILYGE